MLEDALRKLKATAHDLMLIPLPRVPLEFKRTCFICCNNYTVPSYRLGVGPIDDALTVANAATHAGMDVYFLHNPRKNVFLTFLDIFLKRTTSALFFYYVGHGTQVRCDRDEEPDHLDEAFVFDDGFVIDDILVDQLIANKNPKSTVILITDACHSGSIWDLDDKSKKVPKRVISLSAAADSQTAKQLVIDRVEQGAFTSSLYKALKANVHLTAKQLQAKLNPDLKKYQQTLTVETTSPEMLDEPLFQPVPPPPEPEEAPTQALDAEGNPIGSDYSAYFNGKNKSGITWVPWGQVRPYKKQEKANPTFAENRFADNNPLYLSNLYTTTLSDFDSLYVTKRDFGNSSYNGTAFTEVNYPYVKPPEYKLNSYVQKPQDGYNYGGGLPQYAAGSTYYPPLTVDHKYLRKQ